LNDVASEIIAPLLPQFLIGVLGGTRLHLGIIEGLADSTASVLKLLAGGWSDRSGGRKPLVVLGYALATVSRPFLALAQLPWHLLAVRLSDRIGKGLRTAPRDALIVDSTDERARGRAFGFHRGMDHLGAAVGPLLAAGFLWYWPDQIRLLFALAFLPGVLVVVLLVLGLKEVRMARSEGVRRNWKLGQYPPTFRRYLFAILIFTLGNSSDLFLLLRAQELGVATWLMPLLWFSFHVVKSAGNLLAGRAVDRYGARRMLVAGWLWYAAVYLGFALVAHAWLAWLLFLLYAVYYGLAERRRAIQSARIG
jgi:MFS family permease